MKDRKTGKSIFQKCIYTKEIYKIYGKIYIYWKILKKIIKKFIKYCDTFFRSSRFCKYVSFFSFSLFLISFFPAFHTPGLIVFGDLDFGFTNEKYLSRIFPLWNDIWSSSNFFNSTRIYFVGISEITTMLFGEHNGIYQKIIIYLCLQLSFFGMFLLSFKILKTANKKNSPQINPSIIFFICFVSGIFYALNPWSIIRIQHLYLLTGYALLPFIFRHIIVIGEAIKKGNKKKILKHIILAALFYVFAIGSVHYIIFIFAFIATWYVFYSMRLLVRKKWDHFFSLTLSYILFGICIFLLILHWIIPFVGSSFITSQGPENLNTIETLNMFSRFSGITDILYLKSYWWRMIDTSHFGMLYWLGGFFIIGSIFIINIITYKNKYSLFFIIWASILVILSTGTNSFMSEIYETLVFHNPLGETMGSVFRDPNKLVGLLAFCYSILWALSAYHVILKLLGVRQKVHSENKALKKIQSGKLKKIQSLHRRNIILKRILFSFSIFFISFSLISYVYYIKPFKDLYINNFYSAVETPSSYKKFTEYQKNTPENKRYIFLPRYESIQTPGYGFAVTEWNNSDEGIAKKPTGSIDLATTISPTYHPLEGVHTAVGYFYDYIQSYLQYDKGRNIHKYLDMLNIDSLVFHKDIIGLEKKQINQLYSLQHQEKLEKVWGSDFMHVFHTNGKIGYHQSFMGKIFMTGGLSKLESFFRFSNLDYSNYAYLLLNQKIQSIRYDASSDIIVADNKDEVLLNTLDQEKFFFPFSQSKNYDPYFRWSVLKTHVPDFRWHLKQLGIDNWNWDFDYGKGFIFTYAPAAVDIKSYNNIFNYGRDLIDLTSYNDISELFTIENEDLSLSLDKKNKGDNFAAIKGNVRSGEDQRSWKVASMKKLHVHSKHPYTIELTLSGVGIQNVHGKVKFLDAEGNETGIAYVIAPQYIENFEGIKFRGSFVTPASTKNIVIEILSSQKPEKDSYWWLHDIKLKDLGKYKIPNTLGGSHTTKEAGEYLVFSRSFQNIKGGTVHFTIENAKFPLSTKTKTKNIFEWQKLGSVYVDGAKEVSIQIENIDGFNAINALIFIKKSEWEIMQKNISENALTSSKQIIISEGEFDMEYEGNIQSKRYHPQFSNGRGISLYNGTLYKDFDIFQDSEYMLELGENSKKTVQGDIIIEIYRSGEKIYDTILSRPSGATNVFSLGTLKKGSYQIQIRLKDTSKSLIIPNDISKSESRSDEEFDEEDEIGCTYYDGLPDDQSSYSYGNNGVNITLRRGTSCFWLISTHKKTLKVNEKNEYLVSYESEYSNTKKLHSKITFYDVNNTQLEDETIYLYDHGSVEGKRNKKVEEIIEVPKNAKYMQLEFWQKQIQEHLLSQVQIKDIQIRKISDMLSLDGFMIYDSEIKNISPSESALYESGSKMQQRSTPNVKTTRPHILQLSESYSPLWQIQDNDHYTQSLIINMFMNGYEIYENTEKQKVIVHRSMKMMYFGYTVSIISILLLCISYYLLSFHYVKISIQCYKVKSKIKKLI